MPVGRGEREHLSTLGRTKLIWDEEQTLSLSYYAASGKQCVLQNSIFLQREHPRTGTTRKGSGLAEDQARPRAAAAFQTMWLLTDHSFQCSIKLRAECLH